MMKSRASRPDTHWRTDILVTETEWTMLYRETQPNSNVLCFSDIATIAAHYGWGIVALCRLYHRHTGSFAARHFPTIERAERRMIEVDPVGQTVTLLRKYCRQQIIFEYAHASLRHLPDFHRLYLPSLSRMTATQPSKLANWAPGHRPKSVFLQGNRSQRQQFASAPSIRVGRGCISAMMRRDMIEVASIFCY
jgi:hypothetical protein